MKKQGFTITFRGKVYGFNTQAEQIAWGERNIAPNSISLFLCEPIIEDHKLVGNHWILEEEEAA